MRDRKKLAWLGGGLALGAIAMRRSIARAASVDSLLLESAFAIRPSLGRGVSRRFDALFARYGRGIPVAYLRALAKRESNMNPGETSGPAWGLLQVIEVVRRDFNERTGMDYARRALLEPRINISIATDLLRRIIASYARNHPRAPNMQKRWTNPRFVELLTFGWNAGYSERGGVGRVARYLEDRGLAGRITIDTVHQAARPAGASRHLSNPRKVAWCKGVATLFAKEQDRG